VRVLRLRQYPRFRDPVYLSSANETSPGTALSPCTTGAHLHTAPQWHFTSVNSYNVARIPDRHSAKPWRRWDGREPRHPQHCRLTAHQSRFARSPVFGTGSRAKPGMTGCQRHRYQPRFSVLGRANTLKPPAPPTAVPRPQLFQTPFCRRFCPFQPEPPTHGFSVPCSARKSFFYQRVQACNSRLSRNTSG
jgi:hypothetical protein